MDLCYWPYALEQVQLTLCLIPSPLPVHLLLVQLSTAKPCTYLPGGLLWLARATQATPEGGSHGMQGN